MKLRQQYHFQESDKGLLAWDVLRLIELTKKFKIKSIPLLAIQELNEEYWYQLEKKATCKSLVEHVKLINAANLDYPIILCHNGRVMDGMHRVCKALLEGHQNINAVQFETEVTADYSGILPDDLPY